MRRQRSDAVQVLGERALPADRNLIVREGLPDPVGAGGQGIVQRVSASLAVDQAAKIALPHRGSRHADRSGGRRSQSIALIRKEEEGLVFSVVQLGEIDRSSQRGAQLISR